MIPVVVGRTGKVRACDRHCYDADDVGAQQMASVRISHGEVISGQYRAGVTHSCILVRSMTAFRHHSSYPATPSSLYRRTRLPRHASSGAIHQIALIPRR